MGLFRTRPTGVQSDNTLDATPGRNSWYGERYTIGLSHGRQNLADEGSYFVCSNATVGTGIAGHAAPVVADTDTKALLHLYNGGTKNIIPDFLFLEVTAAGTAGTIHYAVLYADSRGSTALSSGGTALTPANVKPGVGISTGATVTFGAVVTTTGFTKLGQQIVREVIPVAQDTIRIQFGSGADVMSAGLTTAGTATTHSSLNFCPVVIPPGGNLNLAMIRPSQSAAASYQVHFGYYER